MEREAVSARLHAFGLDHRPRRRRCQKFDERLAGHRLFAAREHAGSEFGEILQSGRQRSQEGELPSSNSSRTRIECRRRQRPISR